MFRVPDHGDLSRLTVDHLVPVATREDAPVTTMIERIFSDKTGQEVPSDQP